MSSPAGQFVLGFVIAFSPAPLVGFGAWSLVNAEDPAPVVRVEPTADHGFTQQREWSSDPLVLHDDPHAEYEGDTTQYASLPQEMEIETDCAKRKRKKIEKRPKPEREIPDF